MAEEAVVATAASGEERAKASDRLAEDLARLREDLRRRTGHPGEKGAKPIGRMRDVVQEKLAKLEKAVEDLRRRAPDLRATAAGGLERTVRGQPLLSRLAAFGVGAPIGRLLALLGEAGRLRARAVHGARAAALWLVAGLLVLVALGVLSAALFLALAASIGALRAALVLGILYGLPALVVALWARTLLSIAALRPDQLPPGPASTAEAARSRPLEMLPLAPCGEALVEITRQGGERDR